MTAPDKLQIVHVNTSLDLRGGERQLLLLAQGLSRRGHEQRIVCAEDSPLEDRARAFGFTVFALPLHDPAHAHGIIQLRQNLRARPCQILHAHDGKGQTVAWLASAGKPVKRFASRRVMFMPSQRIWSRLKYGYTCHAVIAVSAFVKRLLLEAGVRGERIEVIPDGIELPNELPNEEARRKARAQWGIAENDFVAGWLASPAREKGLDTVLEASKLLDRKAPGVQLVLAAENSGSRLGGRDRASVAENGRVHWLGDQENLAEFFAGLDLFLMPSRSEGLGSAALHAMAHGLPVVATRVGGLPEIIEDGKTGWLIAAESPSALAEALALAASNRQRLHEFGLNARRRAQDFSAEVMVDRTESLYRRLIEPSAS